MMLRTTDRFGQHVGLSRGSGHLQGALGTGPADNMCFRMQPQSRGQNSVLEQDSWPDSRPLSPMCSAQGPTWLADKRCRMDVVII